MLLWRGRRTGTRVTRIGMAVRAAQALLILSLMVPTAGAGSKSRLPDAGRQIAPRIDPAMRIPVAPLGFQPPGTSVSTDRTSVLSLSFLDQDHLLFTFRVAGLMKRLPDCPRDDEDQLIRAVVLELPSGKAVAQTEWRMHDYGRYLWPLTDGRVIVRQRDMFRCPDHVQHSQVGSLMQDLDRGRVRLADPAQQRGRIGHGASDNFLHSLPGSLGERRPKIGDELVEVEHRRFLLQLPRW